MKLKFIAFLIIAVFMCGTVYAEAKNSITVDFGPVLVAGFIGSLLSSAADEIDGMEASSFGIGLQYEREIIERLTVAGRYAYLGFGMGMKFVFEDIIAFVGYDISSYSIEAHARRYPFREGVFFIDGMLGYANMSVGVKGDVIISEVDGTRLRVSLTENFSQSYFKYGAKIGWRRQLGSRGGFTYETAFGVSRGSRFGESIGQQMVKKVGGTAEDADYYDEDYNILANSWLVGGPRLTMSMGWSF